MTQYFNGFSSLLRIVALAGIGLFLASCDVEVDNGPPPGRGTICPRIYDPVCGDQYGRQRTYPNSCEARGAGARVIYGGQCRGDGPQRPGRPGRPARPDRPQMCAQIYQPVCARQGRSEQTFPNSCEADRAGWDVVSGGECRRGSDRPRRDGRDGRRDRRDPRQSDGICPKIYQPVCGERDGRTRIFSNDCEARSDGWRVVDDRMCKRN